MTQFGPRQQPIDVFLIIINKVQAKVFLISFSNLPTQHVQTNPNLKWLGDL